jgi:hypothetical protein
MTPVPVFSLLHLGRTHYMDLLFMGHTVEFIGKLMIGFTAVAVHYRFWKEHKIDEQVFREMRRERFVGVIGIVLMIVGYFLQLPSFLG